MSFKFEFFIKSFKIASQYIGTTLEVALSGLVIGLILGLVIALIRFYNVPILSQFFIGFFTILKAIPIVLILLATYLIFAKTFDQFAAGIGWQMKFKDMNPLVIPIFCLSILSTIGLSETFRGTFASIGKGQQYAAKSIGMGTRQIIVRIILPQALPVALPMMSNTLIGLIKASALVSMVGVVDIFAAAKISAQQNYRFLEAYLAVALIYWILNSVIEQGAGLLERNLNRRLRRDAA